MSDLLMIPAFSSFGDGTQTALWVGIALAALFAVGIISMFVYGFRQQRIRPRYDRDAGTTGRSRRSRPRRPKLVLVRPLRTRSGTQEDDDAIRADKEEWEYGW